MCGETPPVYGGAIIVESRTHSRPQTKLSPISTICPAHSRTRCARFELRSASDEVIPCWFIVSTLQLNHLDTSIRLSAFLGQVSIDRLALAFSCNEQTIAIDALTHQVIGYRIGTPLGKV